VFFNNQSFYDDRVFMPAVMASRIITTSGVLSARAGCRFDIGQYLWSHASYHIDKRISEFGISPDKTKYLMTGLNVDIHSNLLVLGYTV